jgi:hypothetical protein
LESVKQHHHKPSSIDGGSFEEDAINLKPIYKTYDSHSETESSSKSHNASDTEGDSSVITIVIKKNQPPMIQPKSKGPLALTSANLKKKDELEKKYFLFACGACNKYFWKRVYVYKPVSRHADCSVDKNQKWEAVPRDKVFGKGKFECSKCGRRWTSPKATYFTKQPCARCPDQWELPLGITKPNERPFSGGSRSGFKHHCELCDTGVCTALDKLKRQFHAIPHESTGSTLPTIISDAGQFGGSNNGDQQDYTFEKWSNHS